MAPRTRERFKKLREARRKKRRDKNQEEQETGARLGTPPPPPRAGRRDSSPPGTPPPPQHVTRSGFKLSNVPALEEEKKSDNIDTKYVIVDEESLLQWVKSFAYCSCGKKMYAGKNKPLCSDLAL